jgi:hypothetical protein
MGPTFKEVGKRIPSLILALLAFCTTAVASPEYDRVYQFESVSWLKPSDNVDGVFAEYLNEQFAQYFSAQSRFIVKPLKGIQEILDSSSAKYTDLIQQPEILRKIAQKFQVECLIRSRVYKEGDTYRFIFEWLFAPKGDLVAQVEFRYLDEGKETGLRSGGLSLSIEKGLNDLIQKLPFLGQVTGVDGSGITVSLGRNAGLKSKQVVTLYSLQNVKRHPVTHTLEEWRWQPIGRARIDQVEASMAFATIIETEPGATVIRNQKVREILTAPEEPKAVALEAKEESPRSGWISGGMGLGTYSRESVNDAASLKFGGSGLLFNTELDSQVWINSRYIAQGSLAGSIFSYSPTVLNTGASIDASYSGTNVRSRLALGYSFFPMKSVFEPLLWAHFGYSYQSMSLGNSPSHLLAESTLGSVFVGIGGEFPMMNRWIAHFGMDLGIFRSGSSDKLSFGAATATSDLTFRAGMSTRLQDRLYLKFQAMLHSQGLSFNGGQTVTQKLFSVTPSLMYYF